MSTRIVEVTITQTETFGIYVEVPENATEEEVAAIAEQIRQADDVLESAYENGDCDTHISSVEEVTPSVGTWVHKVDGSHLDFRRIA